MALPLVPILWTIFAGGAAYAGKKMADSEKKDMPQNTERAVIPVWGETNLSTSNVIALSVSAGVVLALISKKGK